MENINEFLQYILEFIKPELLILIPVIYMIGHAMKKSNKIKDNSIPAILGLVGVLMALLTVLSTSTIAGYKDFLAAIFAAVTQGILCAGTSVYINQFLKQKNKK